MLGPIEALRRLDARIAPILERPGPIIEIWTIH